LWRICSPFLSLPDWHPPKTLWARLPVAGPRPSPPIFLENFLL
jgi:hypothetical protein